MERLTASLVEEGICTITLYAEPTVVGLYEKLGYIKVGVPSMWRLTSATINAQLVRTRAAAQYAASAASLEESSLRA